LGEDHAVRAHTHTHTERKRKHKEDNPAQGKRKIHKAAEKKVLSLRAHSSVHGFKTTAILAPAVARFSSFDI
jgi:hypothetical protein